MTDPPGRDGERVRITVGPAGADHWSDIRALHAFAFRRGVGPWIDAAQCEAFLARVRTPEYTELLLDRDLQVAWYDGRPVGTAGWSPSDDSGTVARMTSVFVSPIFGRLGIGRRLLTVAEERARAAGFGTFVARAYEPSAGFFEALGYARSSRGVQPLGDDIAVPVIFLRKEPRLGRPAPPASATVVGRPVRTFGE